MGGKKRKKNIPIDVSRGKKSKKGKLRGLGSVLPRSGSGSIVARTKTPSKGTTSGGLPGLGRRR